MLLSACLLSQQHGYSHGSGVAVCELSPDIVDTMTTLSDCLIVSLFTVSHILCCTSNRVNKEGRLLIQHKQVAPPRWEIRDTVMTSKLAK